MLTKNFVIFKSIHSTQFTMNINQHPITPPPHPIPLNQMARLMLTKNIDKLRQEVVEHIAADSIVQGIYWDDEAYKGCFIGCLAHSNDPVINEITYGLPIMVQRIAESIFEGLPADKAKTFFSTLPDAISCNGKDLTKVGWQFLAIELRSLPEQPDNINAVIDPVIAGMDLLAEGKHWFEAANAAANADAASYAARAAVHAADAAAYAANAASYAARAAARAAAYAAHAADTADAAVNARFVDSIRLRQCDLLLRLISEAPVMENEIAAELEGKQ